MSDEVHRSTLPVTSPADVPFTHDQLTTAAEMLQAAAVGAFGITRTVLLTMENETTAVLLIERQLDENGPITYERLEIDPFGNTEEVPHP